MFFLPVAQSFLQKVDYASEKNRIFAVKKTEINHCDRNNYQDINISIGHILLTPHIPEICQSKTKSEDERTIYQPRP